jgi:hypothetical protein
MLNTILHDRDTILHDRVRELEGKLREAAPATKADLDEMHERLARIETVLETICRELHVGPSHQRGWRFRRGHDHSSRRNIAA